MTIFGIIITDKIPTTVW